MSNLAFTYIDTIVPLSLPNIYTYHFNCGMYPNMQKGARVLVQFGKKKVYTALVVDMHNRKPEAYQTKEIIDLIDDTPIVQPYQYNFWKWIATYYMCNIGDVYSAALPSGLKPESETKVYPTLQTTLQTNVSDIAQAIQNEVFESPGISINTIESRLKRKGLMNQVRKLADKGLLAYDEKILHKVQPKLAKYISLSADYCSNERLHTVMDRLEHRAPKQNNVLMSYLMLSDYHNSNNAKELLRDEVLKKSGAGIGALNALIEKGVLTQTEKEISRFEPNETIELVQSGLNPAQQRAMNEIEKAYVEKDVVLLHGITSSGKTEIYIKLIQQVIDKGGQVLFLVPEIALTTQLVERLRKVFADKVGVYHSKYNNAERVEVWHNVMGRTKGQREPCQVILGVRSSIFLPFKNLGLIIIDEEHENSFKQYDPAPRYHARDAAIVLASLHKAKVLLGSATPSLESYFNATQGKYALVELKERYLNIQLPEIEIADMVKARKQKTLQGNFTKQLTGAIQHTIDKNQQIILFQNRRGYSQFLECNDCGWVPYCKYCDVSMTYHKHTNRLICHYCGYSQTKPNGCHACGSTDLALYGFGTEKIEDDIKELFPDVKTLRLDLDSTRNKSSHERIIRDFANGKVDILIGTQMVTKGLDFGNVMLVGVLYADSLLNFPDFRSFERAFQLLTQVSGRAGRKHGQGKVVVQTSQPTHQVLSQVIQSDYKTLFLTEINERKTYNYPPYCRMVKIILKHRDKDALNAAAQCLAQQIKSIEGTQVLGPQYPLVARTFNMYQKCIIVKISKSLQLSACKQELHYMNQRLKTSALGKGIQLLVDVDPY